MAENTWQGSIADGVLKNHWLSQQIWYSAIEDSIMADHAMMVDGFGLHSGESANLTRMHAIAEPSDATLIETQRIPEDLVRFTAKPIVIKEMGRAVPYTSLMEDLAHFNVRNAVQRKLREQMTLAIDTMLARAGKKTLLRYTPTGTGADAANTTYSLTTTGTFGAVASRTLKVYDIEELKSILYDTYKAEEVDGGGYIGVFRYRSLLGVRRDPAWQIWHQYTDPQAKYNGETGRIEDVRMLETNHAMAFSYVGTGSVLGEGLVFGQDAIAMAEALTPELRAGIPDDYGRSRGVAWLGELGADIVWDTAVPGESNIVYVGSQ